MNMRKILVILGPTASGKTGIGIKLAKKFDGEVVACDSRQVYKGLDIGSGKLPGERILYQKGEGSWEVDGVTIHLYDLIDATKRFGLFEYLKIAGKTINEISTREKLPIVVGGTGLYLRSLLYGFSSWGIGVDEDMRKELEGVELQIVQEKLKTLSPTIFESLNDSEKKNKRRLIRKIELLESSKPGFEGLINNDNFKGLAEKFKVLKIGLTLPRPEITRKIDERFEDWIDEGLIEEGGRLVESGVSLERLKEIGLQYGLLADLFNGKISVEEFKSLGKRVIRQYAKRQMTWFKREKDVIWIDVTQKNWLEMVEKVVDEWYYSK